MKGMSTGFTKFGEINQLKPEPSTDSKAERNDNGGGFHDVMGVAGAVCQPHVQPGLSLARYGPGTAPA